jgi:hypothetical protein
MCIFATRQEQTVRTTPVDVVHEGATSTVTVNQQILGGQWNRWERSICSGERRRLFNPDDGNDRHVIADAID